MGGGFVSRGVGLHPDRIITSYEVLFVVKGILGIVEDETEYKVHPGQFLILYPICAIMEIFPMPRICNFSGCTITESIQRQRIKYAKTELMNTCDHVNTITYSCGFKDVGYFRRIFKALTGVTPGAYRKTFSRIHINT